MMRIHKVGSFIIVLVLALTTLVAQAMQTSELFPGLAAPTPTPDPAVKRNARPAPDQTKKGSKTPNADGSSAGSIAASHIYEFVRPGFQYGKVVIEHDDAGKGRISFLKDGFDEMITDPVELSVPTLANIEAALTELRFLDSTEDYQFARDYSHLGNVEFTLKRHGRARTAKYNWTENRAAKALMDEYRRLSNEYTWKFEILVARQNQPLLTPGLMETVDSYLGRSEISDPPHLLPFLTELSNDERLPLIARNRALKLIKSIEKQKK